MAPSLSFADFSSMIINNRCASCESHRSASSAKLLLTETAGQTQRTHPFV